jgi:Carboxypeptidase regulatory-like domain
MNVPTYRLALLGAFAFSLVLTGCGGKVKNEAVAPLAPPVDPATAASITGRVTFEGTPPVLHPIDMSANPACMQANPKPMIPTTVVRGANGGLADVVVYVKSGLGHYRYLAPQTPVVLDQKNCMYEPHVLALMVSQPFEVTNGDPTIHNVLVMARNNDRWGSSQPVGSAPVKSTFELPEFAIPILCDIHPWMRAYVFVFDQPHFAVTSKDGDFALKNLPPGTYTIEAWHEQNKTLDQTVTLAPKESKSISFTFRANAQS